MAKNQPAYKSSFFRKIKKFSLSAFMVVTFVAYTLHEHLVGADGRNIAIAAAGGPPSQQVVPSPQVAPTGTPFVFPTPETAPAAPQSASPTLPPTATQPAAPTPTAAAKGQYKSGTYVGPVVDAYYGYVQVKAVVQNGQLANVQFMQYPNDRFTSVRINSIAMPYLTSEAIQAQSANVDIITGATLTSEAFAQSLQTALDAARASS